MAADLVTYFGRSGALLEAEALEAGAPHACVATFHHDPAALLEELESGNTDLGLLAQLLPECACRARIHLEDGEVVLQLIGPEKPHRV